MIAAASSQAPVEASGETVALLGPTSHVALGGRPWPATARVVIVAWTAALSVLAIRACGRDTGRA